MCLIIYKPHNVQVDSEVFYDNIIHSYKNNNDGMGVIIKREIDGSPGLIVHKGLFTPEEMISYLKEKEINETDEVAVHLRMGTSGDVTSDNSHPFILADDHNQVIQNDAIVRDHPVMMHNGVFGSYHYNVTHSAFSDTYHVARQYYSQKHLRNLLIEDTVLFIKIMKDVNASNRVIVMFPFDKGTSLFGTWQKYNEYYFSNACFVNKPDRTRKDYGWPSGDNSDLDLLSEEQWKSKIFQDSYSDSDDDNDENNRYERYLRKNRKKNRGGNRESNSLNSRIGNRNVSGFSDYITKSENGQIIYPEQGSVWILPGDQMFLYDSLTDSDRPVCNIKKGDAIELLSTNYADWKQYKSVPVWCVRVILSSSPSKVGVVGYVAEFMIMQKCAYVETNIGTEKYIENQFSDNKQRAIRLASNKAEHDKFDPTLWSVSRYRKFKKASDVANRRKEANIKLDKVTYGPFTAEFFNKLIKRYCDYHAELDKVPMD